MADIVIRPSLKFVYAGFAAVLVVVIAAAVIHFQFLADKGYAPWLPGLSALLLLWPLQRMLRRLTVKITISGEKLRYESGFLSKSTRIIQLPKVQDVRVNQTLVQRIFNVGDVSIETAGESSRLVVQNLDGPNVFAEEIIEASNQGRGTGLGS